MDAQPMETPPSAPPVAVEEAIAAAAQELPEKVEPGINSGINTDEKNIPENISFQANEIGNQPHQPFLPGTRPAFDVATALDLIEQQELAASDAERAYTAAAEIAKAKQKKADVENGKLRALIRELNERRHDRRYEAPSDDATPNACSGASPELHPGAPAGGDPAPSDGNSGESEGNSNGGTSASSPLGTDHPRSEGTAADVPDSPDGEPPTLRRLLQRAGATVTDAQIAAWTQEQVVEANRWALDQIRANARAEPGHTVSVRWPDHVSAAHHANDPDGFEPVRRIPPRGARKTNRAGQESRSATGPRETSTRRPTRRKGP
jgi:hypothetical protein